MWNKLLVMLKADWGVMLEYRVMILIWMTSGFLPLIMMGLWSALAARGPIGGYSQADFVAYYVVALFVRQMTAVWVSWELDRQIRLGELSPFLLRPMHPIYHHMTENLADKGIRLLVMGPPLLIFIAAVPSFRAYLTPFSIIAFLVALAGAWALVFLSMFACGLLAFWTSQVSAIGDFWYGVRMLFSGIIAPLSFFPPAVAAAASVLPFRFMLSFPAEILLGKLGGQELATGFLLMAAWVALFALLVAWLWRVGVRNYSAAGA